MRKEILCMLLISLGLGSLAPEDVSAGETVTYRGVGTFVANRSTLPLANGGAAFQLANDVVATIEPSESGVLYGDCAGLGYADAGGQYSARAFCTFAENRNRWICHRCLDRAGGGRYRQDHRRQRQVGRRIG